MSIVQGGRVGKAGAPREEGKATGVRVSCSDTPCALNQCGMLKRECSLGRTSGTSARLCSSGSTASPSSLSSLSPLHVAQACAASWVWSRQCTPPAGGRTVVTRHEFWQVLNPTLQYRCWMLHLESAAAQVWQGRTGS